MPGARVSEHAENLNTTLARDRLETYFTHQSRLLHESRDFVDMNAGDGDLGRVHDLVRGPDDRALHVLGDPDDVVEERGDVVVDPDRVGLERRRDPPVANDIGIGDDGAGEITRAQAVDRVRVPDAADVETVADPADQLVDADRLAALEHDVRRGHAGRAVELAAAAGAEPKAVARHERRFRGGPACAELLGEGRVAQQPLGLVPVREAPDERPVLDQIGPSGRQALRT